MRTAPLLAIVLAAGCGGGSDDPPRAAPPARLTADERRLVREYEGRIQTHCVRVARSLVDRRAAPTAAQERRAFAAADALAALVARKPTAPVDVGQDLRLYLSDVVENLEGSNCDPRMVARLERALGAIDAG
ncbi:MAG TPA: hypothetical protein VGW10_01340 [Solirubrobacteraceae bacterium]|nr:hypothetical protein [Solirubrobacteraceae bacterium]